MLCCHSQFHPRSACEHYLVGIISLSSEYSYIAFGEVSSFKWLASFESVVLLAKFIFHGWNRVPQSLYSMRFAAVCNWWNGVTCNERETSRTAVASESHTCISPENTQSLLFQLQLYELSAPAPLSLSRSSVGHSLFNVIVMAGGTDWDFYDATVSAKQYKCVDGDQPRCSFFR